MTSSRHSYLKKRLYTAGLIAFPLAVGGASARAGPLSYRYARPRAAARVSNL